MEAEYIMKRGEDYTGKRYSHWVVIGRCSDGKRWIARCDCGNVSNVYIGNLKRGRSKQCVNCQAKSISISRTTHGLSNTKLYGVWLTMRNRCNNSKVKSYKDYGEKGITVCEEWNEDFSSFSAWAFQNGYKEGLEIDRVNNFKGYSPDNCRWVSRKENARNKRDTRKFEYKDKLYTIPEIEETFGRSGILINARLRRGWTIDDAIEIEPHIGNNQTLRRQVS